MAGDNIQAGVGGALGGVLGSVVGQHIGGSTGAAIGAGVGALVAGDGNRASEAYAEAAYLNGRPEQALIQFENLLKRPGLDYVSRARVNARIETIMPAVLEMRRLGIRDPEMSRN